MPSNTEIKWNKTEKIWYYSFYHNGVRVHRRSKAWTYRKKNLAQAALNDELKKMNLGNSPIDVKFVVVAKEYIEKTKARANSKYTKYRIIKKFILPRFEDRRIKAITASDLNNFLIDLLKLTYIEDKQEKAYSNNYIDKIQTQLWGIFEYALKFEYITSNPTKTLQRVSHNTIQKRKEFKRVDHLEFNRMIDTIPRDIEGQQIKVALLISRETGMRPSEISGLDIDDIKIDSKIIHHHQSWDSKNKILALPKNEKERWIAISSSLIHEIKKLVNMYRSQGIEGNAPLIKPPKRIAKTTIDRWKSEAFDRAKVPDDKRYSWYDMRHSHITELLELGFKPHEIKDRMGHEEIQVWRYVIPDASRQHDMVNALGTVLVPKDTRNE